MSRAIGVVVLGVVAIVAAFTSRPKAVYGEVQWMSGTATLNVGGSMTIGPVTAAGGHIRYRLDASQPLTTAVVESNTGNPTGWCWKNGLNVSQDCGDLPSKQLFVYIKDARSAGIGDNAVKVVIYHWGCVKECGK